MFLPRIAEDNFERTVHGQCPSQNDVSVRKDSVAMVYGIATTATGFGHTCMYGKYVFKTYSLPFENHAACLPRPETSTVGARSRKQNNSPLRTYVVIVWHVGTLRLVHSFCLARLWIQVSYEYSRLFRWNPLSLPRSFQWAQHVVERVRIRVW